MTAVPAPWLVRRLRALGLSLEQAGAIASGTGAQLGDPAGAAADAIAAHILATDPHADRAYTDAKIAALINSAPGLLDTLGEIAAQLATDESAVGALTTAVNARLVKANNLSDLANAGTARTNLGLGTAATHAHGDYDVAGAAAAAQTAAAAYADAGLATKVDSSDRAGVLAYSVDSANVAQPLVAGSLIYLSPRISIPPTTRPVVLYYGAALVCTVAGAGAVSVGVAETTSGAAADISAASINGTFSATGTFAPLIGSVHGSVDLDPSTTWRSFRLLGGLFRDSGSLAASVAASGTTNKRPPYLRGVLG